MHLTHDDLVLHYYGESGQDLARVDAHLSACDECRAALVRLQRTLALVDANAEGEPARGYEATMWARLQDRLEAPAPWWHTLWRRGSARWVLAASTAAIVAVAFYSGWRAREVTAPATTAVVGSSAETAPMRTRVLVIAVGDHLDRAQVVLSEVVNGEAEDADAFAAERLRATDLVATNRLVRQTASLSGDESYDLVLEELERALSDIANAPDDLTVEDWNALKARIDTQGLLFRVRVLADDLRAQQRPAISLPKGKTS